MPRIWERQQDESSKAYMAFCVYRDAGPERSIQKVSQRLSKSSSLVRRWSRRYEWVSRVRAFEEDDERIRQETREAARREAATDLARRENELRERVFTNEERATRLEKEMLDRLEMVLERLPLVEYEEIIDKDGTPVRCIFKPAVPDAILAIKRLHDIASRGLPATLEFESEVRPHRLTYEDRAELQALANDPKLGEAYAKLFSKELRADAEDEGSRAR